MLARVAPVPAAAAGGGPAAGGGAATSFFTCTTGVDALPSSSLSVTPPFASWASAGTARTRPPKSAPPKRIERVRVRIELLSDNPTAGGRWEPATSGAGFERAGVNHTCSLEVTRLFRAK